jgi:cytochrome c553
MNPSTLGLYVLLGCCIASAVHAADADRGKTLFATCAACHGQEAGGNPALQAPALAGQDAAYIARQLNNFRAGIRGADAADTSAAQMRASVAVLADEAAVADLAAYVASLPPFAAAPGEAGGDLRNGNNFYQGKCGACHGGKAEGNAALSAPRLAGQDTAYLRRQFLAFRGGKRGTQADDRYGRQMAMMAATLPSEKDIDDVLAFIRVQQGSATH